MHLEESLHIPGFREARIAAESSVRERAFQKGIHEITLDEIYGEMHISYRELQQKEIQLELIMCKANPEMKNVFDKVLQEGKPIYSKRYK